MDRAEPLARPTRTGGGRPGEVSVRRVIALLFASVLAGSLAGPAVGFTDETVARGSYTFSLGEFYFPFPHRTTQFTVRVADDGSLVGEGRVSLTASASAEDHPAFSDFREFETTCVVRDGDRLLMGIQIVRAKSDAAENFSLFAVEADPATSTANWPLDAAGTDPTDCQASLDYLHDSRGAPDTLEGFLAWNGLPVDHGFIWVRED
jgi:hypothetical protein